MTKFGSALEHEKYEELCALATAGVLTPAESDLLTRHLEACAQCREAFVQYQNIAIDGMSFLVDHFATVSNENAFDESSALARLIQAAERDEPRPVSLTVVAGRKPLWNRTWVHGLVAASLVTAVGIGAFWTGSKSATNRLRSVSTERWSAQSSLEQGAAEKQALERTIQANQQKIAALEQQAIADKNDMTMLRVDADAKAEHLADMTAMLSALKKGTDSQLIPMTQERDANANKLHNAEKMYETVQDELITLRSQHQQDLTHLASLETHVNSLTAEFNEQNKHVKTDEQSLPPDKDIRDLISARNLYIADIEDVNENGQSRKPFGRVFYTKTKSLIFYAYDLDRQPGIRRTSTFQVWGRTSANDRKPINLGILYMDSEMNRRWTLSVDNPEQLARLDAIYVTIEPREQTDKPTGKPFLYASLQREPNHP
jgi:hypothetical protein